MSLFFHPKQLHLAPTAVVCRQPVKFKGRVVSSKVAGILCVVTVHLQKCRAPPANSVYVMRTVMLECNIMSFH